MRLIVFILIISIAGILVLTAFFKSLQSPLIKLPQLKTTSVLMSKQTPTPIDHSTFQEKKTTTGFHISEEKKGEEDFSYAKIPPSDHMATPGELFKAVNIYRQNHHLSLLNSNQTLCEIAQKRIEEVELAGALDHSGFEKYTESQHEFSLMGEILFSSPYPQSGTNIVELGWDKSQTGHKEELLNTSYTHGCGGIKAYLAVFVFGG